ncbi:MAG: hypothetical protein C5B58_07135 [Acidobacteria bacterium]|nr:MAG: hypothetical protein C5B58_07135 [Acidobacteriota bacterium]
MKRVAIRLKLLGVGAMNSPRYAPAGLLVQCAGERVMLDGGPGATPNEAVRAWLVTDEHGELMREIRALARIRDVEPKVATYSAKGLTLRPRKVRHTSHATYGYLIEAEGKKIVWAPEFFAFPVWARGADLMFAEAAAWNRPIHFAGGVGGHACALDVARKAKKYGVRRLILAHIGRPTIRAIDAGQKLPFGEFGEEGRVYTLREARGRLADL